MIIGQKETLRHETWRRLRHDVTAINKPNILKTEAKQQSIHYTRAITSKLLRSNRIKPFTSVRALITFWGHDSEEPKPTLTLTAEATILKSLIFRVLINRFRQEIHLNTIQSNSNNILIQLSYISKLIILTLTTPARKTT